MSLKEEAPRKDNASDRIVPHWHEWRRRRRQRRKRRSATTFSQSSHGSVHSEPNKTSSELLSSTKSNHVKSFEKELRGSSQVKTDAKLQHMEAHLSPKSPPGIDHLHPYAPRTLLASSTEGQLKFIFLTIGLPILALLMLSLVFCYIWSYCKRLARLKSERKHSRQKSKVSKRLKSTLREIKILGSNERKNSSVSKTLGDKRQLTINMEHNEPTSSSDENQSNSSGSISSQKQKNLFTISHNPFIRLKKGLDTNGKVPGDGHKSGQLKYSLSYDFDQSKLTVNIIEACNLPAMDLCGTSDPYVRIYLTSNEVIDDDKQQQTSLSEVSYKTRVHKRQLNPQFNESFEFEVPYGLLMKQTLKLHMFDYDRLSKHDEIGQISLPLSSMDFAQVNAMERWSELEKTNQSNQRGQLGDICLSLRYVPTAGRLTVVILEARKLKKMDLAGLSDPYVKLALLNEDGKRLKKRKTSIKKCTLNPHYNESFSFEIPFEQVQKVQLQVTVIDYDRIGTSEPIGRIILGCDSSTTSGDTELRHWMDILASPRRPIAQWHCLKPLTASGDSSYGNQSNNYENNNQSNNNGAR